MDEIGCMRVPEIMHSNFLYTNTCSHAFYFIP